MHIKFENAHGYEVRTASELLSRAGATVLVVAVGENGETNAEAILSKVLSHYGLPTLTDLVVLWSTPAAFSLTGEALLRPLHIDGASLEWGPSLQITDAPDIHEAAARCNVELLASMA